MTTPRRPFPLVLELALAALVAAAPRAQERAAAPGLVPVTVTVRVVDGRGTPLEGAGLIAGWREDLQVVDALERPPARTGKDGQLRTTVAAPAAPELRHTWTFLVAAKGKVAMAMAHHPEWFGTAVPSELDLGDVALFDGVTLRGRVVNAKGLAVAGARVTATDGMRRQREPLLPGGAHLHALARVRTDDQGAFVLPSVPDGGVDLRIAADGCYEHRLFPVGRETPLTLELRPSGFVTGRALGSDGNGIATTLSVQYECGGHATVRTHPDGGFRFTVAQPGRFRVRNQLPAGAGTELLSPVLDGPRENLQLAAAGAGPTDVVVRAVSEASGAELTSFRAVLWYGRDPMLLQEALRADPAQLQPSDAKGRVRLTPRPGAGASMLFVVAAGHAPAHVALDAGEGTGERTVALGPESWVSGRLVDTAGQGVAGARIWTVAVEPGRVSVYRNVPTDAEVTGADGGFWIGGLGEGSHVVQAWHADLPAPEAVHVKIAPARPARDMTIRLPAHFALHGKVQGRVPAGSWLRAQDVNARVSARIPPAVGALGFAIFQGARQPHWRRIGADGSYRFEGLREGVYEVVLVQPALNRFAPPLEFTLGEIGVTKDRVQDFETVAAGRLVGTVTRGDAALTFDRLLVLALPQTGRRGAAALVGQRSRVVAAPVDARGCFALELAPGSHDLRVLDAVTGVTLHASEGGVTVPAGGEASAGLELQVTRVPVRLVPALPDAPVRVSSLAVEGKADPAQQTFLGVVFGIGNDDLRVEPGQDEVVLWLPPGDFTVKARSQAGFLVPGRSFRTLDLASQAVSVSESGTLPVELKVAPPPPVDER